MVLEGFLARQEWLETTIDHPIERYSQAILFPRGRPCRQATLIYQDRAFPLHVLETREGRTELRVRIPSPRANTPYLICWSW